jgi:hypothetical protein
MSWEVAGEEPILRGFDGLAREITLSASLPRKPVVGSVFAWRRDLTRSRRGAASSTRDEGGIKAQRGRGSGTFRHPVVYITGFLMMLSVATSSAYSQGDLQKTAASDLNEFDVASSCYGSEHSDESGSADQVETSKKRNVPESRFGYVRLSTEQNAGNREFVYITSRYYVHTGPYGDPAGCVFKRYLYRLKDRNLFKREEVDENGFSRTKSELDLARRAYERSSPGKIFGKAELGARDSVGDCLFPIHWYTLRGQDYALLSIVHGNSGIVDYVIPHYQRTFSGNPSTCFAWGERHLTNSSIISSEINFLSTGADLLFVEMTNYQKGFLFKAEPDFECFAGQDIFSFHILVKKKFFDIEIRPGLEEIFLKKKPSVSFGDEPNVLSFLDSVSLSQEFAALVTGFAVEKGCK